MSKVNGQSVAAQRRACGREPPKEKNKKYLLSQFSVKKKIKMEEGRKEHLQIVEGMTRHVKEDGKSMLEYDSRDRICRTDEYGSDRVMVKTVQRLVERDT